MIQGWHNDDYLILFDEQLEAASLADCYAMGSYLPDFALVGLSGWDDFILRDVSGKVFTVPTVPLLRDELRPLANDIATANLRPDSQPTDRIKWYVQPIVFGGDPNLGPNVIWISLEQHVDLVRWRKSKYRELKCA